MPFEPESDPKPLQDVSVVPPMYLPSPFETARDAAWAAASAQLPLHAGNAEVEVAGDESAKPERLVHASIIDASQLQTCLRPNGSTWRLGNGSFGMVGCHRSLHLCYIRPLSALPCPALPCPAPPRPALPCSLSQNLCLRCSAVTLALLFAQSHDWTPGLQVYKAKLGELDVAVKTIQDKYVNPHLTPLEALEVIEKVSIHCLAAAVFSCTPHNQL